MSNYILCSAIWYKSDKFFEHQPKNISHGLVVCGRRHHNCFAILAELFPNREYIGNCEQGFLTSDNFFVSREGAAIIAFRAGQIKSEVNKLTSEDLY